MVARLGLGWCCVFLMLGVVGSASAQDRRVRTGQRLDANYGLGSGRRNRPVPRFVPNRSDLAISGNVTGGRSFRGFSPVRNTSELRTGLPSSLLSSFVRDSVSVGDVVAGRKQYQRRPYFSPERTVTDIGGIRAGLNRPGSSIPRSPYALPRPRARSNNVGGFDFDATRFSDRRRRDLPFTEGSFTGRESRDLTPIAGGFGAAAAPRFPGQAPYGLGTAQGGLLPPPPLPPGVVPGAGPDDAAVDDPARRAGLPRLRFTDPLQNPLYRDPRTNPGGTLDRLLRRRPMGLPADRPGAPRSFDRRDDRNIEPEPDLNRPTEGVRPALPVPSRTFPAPGAADARGGATEAPVAIPVTSREEPKPGTAAHWRLRALLDRPIRSFVHLSTPLADKHLARAEAYLKEGKYYRAAGKYEIAHELDLENPLPLLGKGHAFIGAADFLTAAHVLQRGLAGFSDVARFRLELPAMLSHEHVLDRRRADLEKRLAGTLRKADRYRLAFVLGYIELYSGHAEAGMKHLEAAAAPAPEGTVIRAFPERLRKPTAPVMPPPGP